MALGKNSDLDNSCLYRVSRGFLRSPFSEKKKKNNSTSRGGGDSIGMPPQPPKKLLDSYKTSRTFKVVHTPPPRKITPFAPPVGTSHRGRGLFHSNWPRPGFSILVHWQRGRILGGGVYLMPRGLGGFGIGFEVLKCRGIVFLAGGGGKVCLCIVWGRGGGVSFSLAWTFLVILRVLTNYAPYVGLTNHCPHILRFWFRLASR